MIQVLWTFLVKRRAVDRFEQAYGPDGPWVRLFASHPGFLGTTLLRDRANPRRYLTIDAWETEAHRERMLTRAKARYAILDAAFAELTESEAEIGSFDTPGAAESRGRARARETAKEKAKARSSGSARGAGRRNTR